MPRSGLSTRERIIVAAAKLFYSEGIRAVSLDAVADKAGVTKRTFYYHFTSKDELVAATLEARDQPNLALFRRWFAAAAGDVAAKTRSLFENLADAARHPKWKGCGFLRTSAELVATPGHPAMVIAGAHKKRVEDWLRGIFEAEEIAEPARLARQVMLLMDGAFAAALLHRDASYMEAAGEAAFVLVKGAMKAQKSR